MQKTMTIKINLPVTFRQENDVYVGLCPPLNVASQGGTPEEAKRNLTEALRLFIFTCIEMGTLNQVLIDCGFKHTPTHPKPANETGIEHIDVELPFTTDFNMAGCHA